MPTRKIIRRTRPKKVEEEEPEVTHNKHTHIGPDKSAMLKNGIPCIYIEKGVTKNLGDFNSARITVGVLLPIDYTDEDLKKIKKAMRVADNIVLDKIDIDVEDLELDD